MSKHYIIPIFIPHSGCPHDCVFCNQRKITNYGSDINEVDVRLIIEKYLTYFTEPAFIEVAFYGGSFTAIDMEIQKKLLHVAYEYKEKGLINQIRLSTRPDAINQEILANLKKYKVDTIELGVQSLNSNVLIQSNRGHSIESVYKASSLIKSYNIKLGLQMMLGLPGDNIKRDIETALEFVKLKPDCIRIYPTLVIKNTHLEKMYLDGRYKPLSIEEAVYISSIILMIFNTNNLNVIRVGLQATENIQLGKDVIAGPFHPAFRQLVEEEILKNIIDKSLILINGKLIDNKILKIYCAPKYISNVAGQKASNKKYLKDKYKLKDIKILSDTINTADISLEIENKKWHLNLNNEIEKLLDEKLKEALNKG